MKTLLVAVNCKYVHTNLALRYLKQSITSVSHASIFEFSINDNPLSVEREIILFSPDILAFSCYIWNIDYILGLCSDIKKALPDVKIILGGPEVSFDSVEVLSGNPCVDIVVKGEGELTLPLVVESIKSGKPFPHAGITYRLGEKIVDTPCARVPDFSEIPFPYDDLSFEKSNKILYYESSRGCPYSCKYCLSGDKSNLRFKDAKDVCRDLDLFDSHGIELVKFVDRTFNADRKRAVKIWEHIASLVGKTRFHMEISGELLDDKTIEALGKVPSGKLQFEIGVQTTNRQTLEAIGRKSDISKLFEKISKVLNETSIHTHLDLIVGLPYEDMESFKKSFTDVISLRPHVLQIGFLKVLKGSAMHTEAEKYGIVYRDKAPYEIISNYWLTPKEILYLKDFEFVFDKVYNSGSFNKTVDCLFSYYSDYFFVFSELVLHFQKHNLINLQLSKADVFSHVYDCFSHLGTEFEESLRFDYILALKSGTLPNWANTDMNFRYSDEVYAFLKDEDAKNKIMPKFFGVPAKAAIKQLRFEKIGNKVFAFDLKSSDVYDVSIYFQ